MVFEGLGFGLGGVPKKFVVTGLFWMYCVTLGCCELEIVGSPGCVCLNGDPL